MKNTSRAIRLLAIALPVTLFLSIPVSANQPGESDIQSAAPTFFHEKTLAFNVSRLDKWMSAKDRYSADYWLVKSCMVVADVASAATQLFGVEWPKHAPATAAKVKAKAKAKAANAPNCSTPWVAKAIELRSQAPVDLLAEVNALANKATYVAERRDHDYWESPSELFSHGGDCEDYAISKFLLLRAAGVSSQNMRILILGASPKSLAHAVLVVDRGDGPIVLDNLRQKTYPMTQSLAGRAVYAFNDQSMWLVIHEQRVANR
jgi:predicted transglutaminase-like cysteine proteinase